MNTKTTTPITPDTRIGPDLIITIMQCMDQIAFVEEPKNLSILRFYDYDFEQDIAIRKDCTLRELMQRITAIHKEQYETLGIRKAQRRIRTALDIQDHLTLT